jgi:hypothetical protein
MVRILSLQRVSEIFGCGTPGIVTLLDPVVGSEHYQHGQLRALPMIADLGVKNFTFVDSWSTYKLIDFEYYRFGPDLILKNVFPICQFISQEIEDHSDLDITQHLLNLASSNQKATLFLVLDSAQFCLKNNQDGKPMIEDWDLSDSVYEYTKIFPVFLRKIGIVEPPISLTETQNLVFQKMAQTHLESSGDRPHRLSTLFDFESAPSKSSAWEVLRSLANRKAAIECHSYVHDCIRSWVDSDITRVTDNIMSGLQRCQFDPEKVDKLRMKREKEEHRA